MSPPLLPYQKRQRILVAAGFILLLGTLALLPERTAVPFPPCVFKQLSGLPCPFCGGTRSAQALLHGDWSRALYLNPLAFAAVGAFALAIIVLSVEIFRGRLLVDWAALPSRYRKFFPFALGILLGWWGAHIAFALGQPKSELIDLRNPIAKAVYVRLNQLSPH